MPLYCWVLAQFSHHIHHTEGVLQGERHRRPPSATLPTYSRVDAVVCCGSAQSRHALLRLRAGSRSSSSHRHAPALCIHASVSVCYRLPCSCAALRFMAPTHSIGTLAAVPISSRASPCHAPLGAAYCPPALLHLASPPAPPHPAADL
eukprot:1138948-Pelagomonas_calceolata.AAC.6